jgi:hypothetical protein
LGDTNPYKFGYGDTCIRVLALAKAHEPAAERHQLGDGNFLWRSPTKRVDYWAASLTVEFVPLEIEDGVKTRAYVGLHARNRKVEELHLSIQSYVQYNTL